MAISCSRSLSSSTSRILAFSRTLRFSPLIVFTFISSKKPSDFPRTSLRGVGQCTRRTARQSDPEVAARSAVHHGDLATVRLDQLAGDRQAQAGALDAAGINLRATAEKQVENRLALFRRHARAAVHNLQHRFPG